MNKQTLIRCIIINITIHDWLFVFLWFHHDSLSHHKHDEHVWSICCCKESSWMHISLSFLISSWGIANYCCIYIPIILIILSRDDLEESLLNLILKTHAQIAWRIHLSFRNWRFIRWQKDRYCYDIIIISVVIGLWYSNWRIIGVAIFKKSSSDIGI